ncbi:MAG: ABC transporter permease [Actinobacteria bacterium]|nr:MAG: ABC transporter permease [Actinomycetota bacterium]
MTAGTPDLQVRSGPGYWLGSYTSMLRMEVLSLRSYLVLALIIQVFMGAGMALMYGYYFGELDQGQQTFLVTGIPALALIPIGFVMVPNSIMELKLRDTYDYVWSLPVPRAASASATFTVFSTIAIPGTIAALFIASVVYDVDLHVSWAIVPAVLLTSAMATSIGYAMGHAIPQPRVINLIGNMVIFLVLLFSPIVVAIDQFPDWWAAVHRVLPFWHMSVIIRAGLTEGMVTTSVVTSYLVVIAWTVVSWLIAAWVVGRRR